MTQFQLRRADGSTRTVGGYSYAPPPAAAKPLSASVDRLPPKVDLRPHLTPVEDQEQTNSCAANAAAGAYEYLMKRCLGEASYDVSRLFIYFNARAEDTEIRDEGSVLSKVIDGLAQHGACSEGAWPFDAGIVNESPSDDAYEEARQFVIDGSELVPTDLRAWKTALAAGYPIIFGLSLYDSFDKQKQKGLVPTPTSSESSRDSHGGHAMLCVGYSDADQTFIVRNSWGTSWGDGGYCYIPYRYMMDPTHNFGDSWIIRNVDVLPADETGWGDESTILEDAATVIGSMSDEEWAALLEGMGPSPFEQRLAALFLRCAAADGHVDDAELEVIAQHLAPVYAALGSRFGWKSVSPSGTTISRPDEPKSFTR